MKLKFHCPLIQFHRKRAVSLLHFVFLWLLLYQKQRWTVTKNKWCRLSKCVIRSFTEKRSDCRSIISRFLPALRRSPWKSPTQSDNYVSTVRNVGMRDQRVMLTHAALPYSVQCDCTLGREVSRAVRMVWSHSSLKLERKCLQVGRLTIAV